MKTSKKCFAVFVPRTNGVGPDPHSEEHLSKSAALSLRVQGKLRVDKRGPDNLVRARMEGVVKLPGLGTQVLFRSNGGAERPGVNHVFADAMLVPEGGELRIPKEWATCPDQGHSSIAIQFADAFGTPLTQPQLLGDMARQSYAIDCEVAVPATVGAWIAARECSAQDVSLGISGEMSLDVGLMAFIHVGSGESTSVPAVLRIVSRGKTVTAPEQSLSAEVAASSEVSVQFRDALGTPIGDESSLGLCVPADWPNAASHRMED